MGRVRAGHERLGRNASRSHTGAAKLVALTNGDCHARGRIMAHPVSGLYHKEANTIPARNVDAN